MSIASFIRLVIGFPLAGAFWLMGAASTALALGFTVLSFLRIEGATLDSVPVRLGTLLLAFAGGHSGAATQAGARS